MSFRMRFVVVLVVLLAACGDAPLPRETLEMHLDLDPGATQTIHVSVAVSATENAFFRTWIDPTPARLADRGVDVVLGHRLDAADGADSPDWPHGEPLSQDVPRTAVLTAVFTNEGAGRVAFDVAVGVGAYTGGVPDLYEDEASISVTRIDDG